MDAIMKVKENSFQQFACDVLISVIGFRLTSAEVHKK